MNLTEGPIVKDLVLYTVPILLSNLFQQLYNSIDAAVLGRFAGPTPLGAVGVAGSLINLLIGFFLGIATGTSVLYAMHYGAGDKPGLKKLVDAAMLLSLLCGLLVSLVGVIFAEVLLRWMATPEELMRDAVTYLRIFFAGTLTTMFYNVGAGMIRAEGDSRRPLIYLLVGGVSNLVLDVFMVAVLHWGAAGAAIATVAAQAISAVLVILRLTRLDPEYRLDLRHMKISGLALWDVVRISIPCGLQGSMYNISNILVQSSINGFGATAVAGVSAYYKLDAFIYMPMGALSLAVSTYVGQNIGAGKFGRVKRGIRFAVWASAAACITVGLGIILFARPLLSLFTTDEATRQVSLGVMPFLAPFGWTLGFSDILGGAIRGAGQAGKVTLITALCICVFRIVWIFTMLPVFEDIRVIYLCYPLSWMLSSLVMTIFYFKGSVIGKTIRSAAETI